MTTINRNNFYIITGGPGSGKSTLLAALKIHGYQCVDEVARQIIQDQTRIGGDAMHTKNQIKFRDLMLAESIRTYLDVNEKSNPAFFDRGIPDLLGYCHLINCDVPDQLQSDIAMYRYNKIVFIAPPWEEIYAHDEERKQGWDEAIATYQNIKYGYTEAGYTLIELPKCSVSERVQFTLRAIQVNSSQPHQLSTLADGRQISYEEYGDPNGLPIFYFHGFPGSRLEAGCFSKTAASLGYRLIGIDRPGMGFSSINKSGTILSCAADIANFSDRLNIDKFSIIGHSGGAPFVAACAYAIPERLKGAAIVSGMGPLDHPESKIDMTRQQIIINGLIKAMPFLTPLMMKLNLIMLKKPKMMEKAIQQLPDVDQAIFHDPEAGNALIQSSLEAFRNGVAGPAYELNMLLKPWGFDLEKIKFPITIWHGTLDKQAPVSHARIYASLTPNSQLKLIENEGHYSLLMNHIKEIFRSVIE